MQPTQGEFFTLTGLEVTQAARVAELVGEPDTAQDIRAAGDIVFGTLRVTCYENVTDADVRARWAKTASKLGEHGISTFAPEPGDDGVKRDIAAERARYLYKSTAVLVNAEHERTVLDGFYDVATSGLFRAAYLRAVKGISRKSARASVAEHQRLAGA